MTRTNLLSVSEQHQLEREVPRVHFATFIHEDSGETTPLYLYSHEAIDAEIDQRVCFDPTRATSHEATRTKFHAALSQNVASAWLRDQSEPDRAQRSSYG
jgi:hypothetical protein